MMSEVGLGALAVGVFLLAMAATNGATEPIGQNIVLLQRGNTEERREAVGVLARLGDKRAINPLATALRDPDTLVREGAERAMWQIFHRSGRSEIDAQLEAGMLAMQRRALPQAIEIFSRVIEQEPNFAEGYNKRATTYYMMQEFDKSIADCEKTIELNPMHFGALSGAGLCYLGLRNLTKALEYFEKAVAVNPNMPQIDQYIEDIKRFLRDQSL